MFQNPSAAGASVWHWWHAPSSLGGPPAKTQHSEHRQQFSRNLCPNLPSYVAPPFSRRATQYAVRAPLGPRKTFFFPQSVSYFAPNSASTVMTQHPGQLQHIANVSSIVVGFCKYSKVFLNLVCGDKSHFYSIPLLVTAPTASMVLDQVCSRIRKAFQKLARKMPGNSSGSAPENAPEGRPANRPGNSKKSSNLFICSVWCSGMSSGKLSGNVPENCHENLPKKARKIPGLVTERSA